MLSYYFFLLHDIQYFVPFQNFFFFTLLLGFLFYNECLQVFKFQFDENINFLLPRYTLGMSIKNLRWNYWNAYKSEFTDSVWLCVFASVVIISLFYWVTVKYNKRERLEISFEEALLFTMGAFSQQSEK